MFRFFSRSFRNALSVDTGGVDAPGSAPEGLRHPADLQVLPALEPASLQAAVSSLCRKHGIDPDLADRIRVSLFPRMRRFGAFTSLPDEIPDFRRVVVLGEGWSRLGMRTALCVSGNGRMIRWPLAADTAFTVGDIPRLLDTRHPDISARDIRDGLADLNLNAHGFSGLVAGRDEAEAIIAGLCRDLGPDRWRRVPYALTASLEHVVQSRLSRHLRLARHAVTSALEPDMLRLMRSVCLTLSSDAEWFSGVPQGEAHLSTGPASRAHDGNLEAARMQAVRSYPAMARPLRDNGDYADAIDARRPLAPLIAADMGVSEAGVRLIQGLTWQKAGVRPSDPMVGLVRIASLPRDFLPSGRPEYRQLPLIAGLSCALDSSMPETIRWMASGGSPYRFGRELMNNAPEDIIDAAAYVADKLLRPARLHGLRRVCEREPDLLGAIGDLWKAADIKPKAVLRGLSARAVFDLSERWHRALPRHDDRLVSLKIDAEWRPLVGLRALPSGTVLREIASAREMKDQGRREGHCVGGYVGEVVGGGPDRATLIFSIEKDGAVIGTAQIAIIRTRKPGTDSRLGDAHHVKIIQNRASKNAPVGAEAKKAAASLRRHLAGIPHGEFLSYVQDLARTSRKSAAARALPPHVVRAGYDIWNRERLEAAWDELSPYLPRRVRKAGLDALIDSMVPEGEVLRLRERDSGKSAGTPRPPFWEVDGRKIGDFLSGAPPEVPAVLAGTRAVADHDDMEIPF